MSGYILHPEANNDLDEIWEYIAKGSYDADRVREEIHQGIRALEPLPY